jgi:hypothetical protein
MTFRIFIFLFYLILYWNVTFFLLLISCGLCIIFPMQQILELFQKRVKETPFLVMLVLSGVVVSFIAGMFFVSQREEISFPQEFVDARLDAAVVSTDIVELTQSTNTNIRTANTLEEKGLTDDALLLIAEARASNEEAYDTAFMLSAHLQRMTESLPLITPAGHRQLAYEAIAVELSLVSEFISYTQSLNTFLDSLTQAITTNTFADREAVKQSLASVNESTEKINALNNDFLSRMSQFDGSL